MNTEYNGWKNYQTWLTYTWLTNDEEEWSYWSELAEKHTVSDLMEMLKHDFNESIDESMLDSGLLIDLLIDSVSEIDFRELAEHLKSQVE